MQFSQDVFQRYFPVSSSSSEESRVSRLLWGNPPSSNNNLFNVVGIEISPQGKFVPVKSSPISTATARRRRRPQSARPLSKTATHAPATTTIIRKPPIAPPPSDGSSRGAKMRQKSAYFRASPNTENSMPMGNHAVILRPKSARLVDVRQQDANDRVQRELAAKAAYVREEQPWAFPEALLETDTERQLFRLQVDSLVQKEVGRKRDKTEFELKLKQHKEQKQVMSFVQELSLKMIHSEHEAAASKTLLDAKVNRLHCLEKNLEDAQEDAVSLREELVGSKTEVERLQIDLKAVSEDCTRLKKRETELTTQVEHFQQQEQLSIAKYIEMEHSFAQLQTAHSELQRSSQASDSRATSLNEKLATAQATVTQQADRINTLQAQIKEQSAQIVKLTTANNELSQSMKTKTARIAELQYMQATYDFLQSQYNQQDEELKALKQEMAVKDADMEERMKQLRMQEEANRKSSAATELKECRVELKKAQDKQQELQQQLDKQQESFTIQHRVLLGRAGLYDSFAEHYKELCVKQPRLEHELKMTLEQLRISESTLSKRTVQWETEKLVAQRFRTRSMKLDGVHSVAKSQIRALEGSNTELKTNLERVRLDSQAWGDRHRAVTEQLRELSQKYLATHKEISRLEENVRVLVQEKAELEGVVNQYRDGHMQDMKLIQERDEAQQHAKQMQLRLEYFEVKDKGLREKLETNDALMHDTLETMDKLYALIGGLRQASMLHVHDAPEAMQQGMRDVFAQHGDVALNHKHVQGKSVGQSERKAAAVTEAKKNETKEAQNEQEPLDDASSTTALLQRPSSEGMVELVRAATHLQASLLEKEDTIHRSRQDLMKMRTGMTTISDLKNQLVEAYEKHEQERKQWKANRIDLENEIQFLQQISRRGSTLGVVLETEHEQQFEAFSDDEATDIPLDGRTHGLAMVAAATGRGDDSSDEKSRVNSTTSTPSRTPGMSRSRSNASITSNQSRHSSVSNASRIIQDDANMSAASRLQAKKLEHTVTFLMNEAEQQSGKISDLTARLDVATQETLDVTAQRNVYVEEARQWRKQCESKQEQLDRVMAQLSTFTTARDSEEQRAKANRTRREELASQVTLGLKYRDSNDGCGVRVTTVVPNTCAESAGLQIGDVLCGVFRVSEGKQRDIKMSADLIDVESKLSLGEECYFLVRREKKNNDNNNNNNELRIISLFVRPFGHTTEEIQRLLQ